MTGALEHAAIVATSEHTMMPRAALEVMLRNAVHNVCSPGRQRRALVFKFAVRTRLSLSKRRATPDTLSVPGFISSKRTALVPAERDVEHIGWFAVDAFSLSTGTASRSQND